MRRAKDLTQIELGTLVGMSGHQISNLEKGINKPTLEGAFALAEALGTTVDAMVKEGLSDAEQ